MATPALAAMSAVNPALSQNLDTRPKKVVLLPPQVLSNTPVMIDGKPAVRVHIRFKNDRGLPIERVMVALVDTKGRLSIQYEAPAIVYFQRGLMDFEAMVASVRFIQHAKTAGY